MCLFVLKIDQPLSSMLKVNRDRKYFEYFLKNQVLAAMLNYFSNLLSRFPPGTFLL